MGRDYRRGEKRAHRDRGYLHTMPQEMIFRRWWCVLKKAREVVSIGEPVPRITLPTHPDFFMQLQKAMLLSLVHRKLLSVSQMERVWEELELKTYEKTKKSS